MKVIAGVDGSKYGRWATEWIAQLPFASSPQVTALHVVDVVSLRAPFVVQPVVIGNCCASLRLWTGGLVSWMQETH
jgi:hypothetical protein